MSAPADAQIGLAKETTYGVYAAPSRYYPLLSPEMVFTPERLESEGVVAGLDIIGSEQWNGGNISVGGNCGFELYAGEMGLLLELMFGTIGTTGSGPYTHTAVPTTGELPSATVVVGKPRPFSPVIPAVHLGCKVADWEVACSQGAIATVGLNLVAKDARYGSRSVADGVTTNTSPNISSATAAWSQADVGKSITGTGIAANTTIASVTSATAAVLSANATATGTGVTFTIGPALTTATYGTLATKPLKFNHATLSLGGAVQQQVTEVSVTGNNALKVDRRSLGSQLISEPVREGRREFMASFAKEFIDTVVLERLINGTEGALVLNFTAGAAQVEISGNVRVDQAESNPDGKSVSQESIECKFVRSGNTAASAIQAKIVSASATP